MEGFWLRGFGKVVQGEMPPRHNKVDVKKVDLPSRAMLKAILLVRINIRKE